MEKRYNILLLTQSYFEQAFGSSCKMQFSERYGSPLEVNQVKLQRIFVITSVGMLQALTKIANKILKSRYFRSC